MRGQKLEECAILGTMTLFAAVRRVLHLSCGQDVIHIGILKRDALRFDLLEIKRAQNRFVVSLRVHNEMVYGGDASFFHDGRQGSTWDGNRLKLERGEAFLEVELFDVFVGRGGHLVQEKGMGVKVVVLARRSHVDGAVIVADRDVQELYLVITDAALVVVFQDVIEKWNGLYEEDVLACHRLVVNGVIVRVANVGANLEVINVRGFVGVRLLGS